MSSVGNPVPLSVAGVAVSLQPSPGVIVGGLCLNDNVTDGYLLFWDKPPAEVNVGVTPHTHFVKAFAFGQIDLCRAGEGILFRRHITVACVTALAGSSTGVPVNLSAIIQ